MSDTNQKHNAKLMRELQNKFIEDLTERLKTKGAMSASELSVVRQFLKDNNFTVDPLENRDAMDDLMKELDIPRVGLPATDDLMN